MTLKTIATKLSNKNSPCASANPEYKCIDASAKVILLFWSLELHLLELSTKTNPNIRNWMYFMQLTTDSFKILFIKIKVQDRLESAILGMGDGHSSAGPIF